MSHSKYGYANHTSVLKKVRVLVLVLVKAKGKCEICGNRASLVHHRDGSTVNHKLDNLIALCVPCHNAAHKDDTGAAPRKTRSKYARLFGVNLTELSRITDLTPWMILKWADDPEKKALLIEAVKNPEATREKIAMAAISTPPSVRKNTAEARIRRRFLSAPSA